MGHESSGEVIAVGDLVTTHKVGDRVAGELFLEFKASHMGVLSLKKAFECSRTGIAV